MIIIGCCFKIAKCELAFGITLLIGSIFTIIFLHKSLSDTRDLSVLIQNSKEYSTDRMNIDTRQIIVPTYGKYTAE